MFDFMPLGYDENKLISYFDSMERNLFGELTSPFNGFRTDILDKDSYFVLRAELPGFDKNNIEIEIEDDFLNITAKQAEETQGTKDNFVCRERKTGAFARSFNIGNIKAEEITAHYSQGVLEIILPKKEKQETYRRRIKIK